MCFFVAKPRKVRLTGTRTVPSCGARITPRQICTLSTVNARGGADSRTKIHSACYSLFVRTVQAPVSNERAQLGTQGK